MASVVRPGLARLRWMLPEGRALDDDVWRRRHVGLITLIWLHAAALALFGLVQGRSILHSVVDVLPLVVAATLAGGDRLSRRWQAGVAAVGLVASSAILVHLAEGSIEAHFHFFVMVGLLSLYQAWFPYLLAIGFVVLHHGAIGALMPTEVFGHPAAIRNPWTWAVIHGAFVLAASVANLLSWKLNEHQLLHDALTGLPNRTLLVDRVRGALATADGRMIGVLFVDIDGFKQVNDTSGHGVGDDLLRSVAERLQAVTRPTDTCARVGGDEFGVLLTGLDTPNQALQAAERFRDAINTPMIVAGRSVDLSASIGVAVGTRAATPDDLLRNADMAMYAGKRSGKGRAKLYEPAMHAALLREAELDADLRRAIADEEFVLHYQPIVHLGDGTIEGFEALVRWDHPTRGQLPPAEFIDRIEETGLVVSLGSWVVRDACRQLAAWDSLSPDRALRVSVNVSARQLQDDAFVHVVGAALEDSGLDPGRLTLEITEGSVMQGSWQHVSRLHALRGIGVKLAIDDFGTGYSALSYLRRLPVDVIKIDKSFVDGVLRGPEDRAIAAAVVTLARSLNLSTVAEGIETAGQRDVLADLGCDRGQGYLYSRPLPADEAAACIRLASVVV